MSITEKVLSAIVIASLLSCASPATGKRLERKSNWKSPDLPCSNFDDLRKSLLRNIGVKIDAAEPWADGFRRALRFWNTILTANLHEETDLSVCSIRIVDGASDIVDREVAARSQLTDWADFGGKIAVSRMAAKEMSNAELYATAVHEIGHILGLKHNVNIHSVMYFLDVDNTVGLDRKDILDLSRHHEVRSAIRANGFVPILRVEVRSP